MENDSKPLSLETLDLLVDKAMKSPEYIYIPETMMRYLQELARVEQEMVRPLRIEEL